VAGVTIEAAKSLSAWRWNADRFRIRTAAENGQGETIGIRVLAMLTRLGQRSREARGHPGRWDQLDYDYDYDYDNDNDKNGAEGRT